MRSSLAALVLVLATLALNGCREAKAQKVPLDMKEIPAAIVNIAKEKLPGVTFDSAFKEPNGSYELRGKDSRGKIREIDIRPDGTVEEIQ